MLEHHFFIQNPSDRELAKRAGIVRGFCAAAFTPVPFGCLGAWYLIGFGGGEWVPIVLFLGGLIAGMAGVLFTAVLGVPAYWILRRLKRQSLVAYLTAGAAISAIAFALMAWDAYGSSTNGAQDELQRVSEIVALVSGPFAAWLFWRTARPDHRPQ